VPRFSAAISARSAILRSFHAASIPALRRLGFFSWFFRLVSRAGRNLVPSQHQSRGKIMWDIQLSVRTLVAFGRRAAHRHRADPVSDATGRYAGPADWLPPVLGPESWSLGLMADRSAGWYFDRD
jgi:hypothetical protein